MAGARRLADAGIQACLQICNRRRHGRRWFGAPAVWPSKTALSALQNRLFRRLKRCWLQAPLLPSWACGHGSSGHDLRCRGPVWPAQAFVGLPQLNVPGKLLARI